jgi:hypothetical protein
VTPLQQVILSLSTEPELWTQNDHTLDHKNGTGLWTSNIPYLNTGIYKPYRKIGLIGGIRLQIAINKWHKLPLIMNT